MKQEIIKLLSFMDKYNFDTVNCSVEFFSFLCDDKEFDYKINFGLIHEKDFIVFSYNNKSVSIIIDLNLNVPFELKYKNNKNKRKDKLNNLKNV